MTICVALRCIRYEKDEEYPALLFASDTQETGAFKTVVNKIVQIYPKKLPHIYIAGTGSGALIDEFANDLRERYVQFYEKIKKSESEEDREFVRYTSQILWVDRKEIANLALEVYKRVGMNPNLGFQCLIGTSDSLKKIELLVVDSLGQFRRGGDFEAIGSGAKSGGYLLLKELYSKDMSTTNATRLAAFVIEKVGSIDAYVSGHDAMKISYFGKTLELTEEKYADRLNEAQERFRLSKRFWKISQDEWVSLKQRLQPNLRNENE